MDPTQAVPAGEPCRVDSVPNRAPTLRCQGRGPRHDRQPGFGQHSTGRKSGGSKGGARGLAGPGEPVEILLYLMGREDHALVDVK